MAKDSGYSGYGMTEEELKKFEEGWVEMMSSIWVDRIVKLHAVDTGQLIRSMEYHLGEKEGGRMIEHSFRLYGFYVAIGAGPHGKRKPKEWYFKAYQRSIEKLKRIEEEALGEKYMGVLRETLKTVIE